MGTGNTIGGSSRVINRIAGGIFGNPSPSTYRYARVVNVDTTNRTIQYEPIEDNIGPSLTKFGNAYPFDKNSGTLPSVGDIVPLVLGPTPESVGNITQEYDKTVLYLPPISINQNVNDNTTTRGIGTEALDKSIKSYANIATGIKGTNVVASKYITGEYLPAMEKQFPNFSKGLKLLLAAHAQLEGFYPGSKSYRTNNPGNVGTYGSGANSHTTSFPTLAEGIQAQYNKVLGPALNGTSKYYKPDNKLIEYLYHYAPPTDGNDPIAYAAFIIGYFAKNGITITADMTITEISKLS
jgi:hypothetical protein